MSESELMACAQAGYEAWWTAQNAYDEKVAIPCWADLSSEELAYWLVFATAFEAAIPVTP